MRFVDKQEQGFDPYEYFDAKAIERRQKHGLPLSHFTDWPVTSVYVAGVQQLVDSITVVTRWFNGVVVHANHQQLAQVGQLAYVRKVELMDALEGHVAEVTIPEDTTNYNYWYELRAKQLAVFGDSLLEDAGLNGAGVRIAVFDAGFRNANVHPAFQHMRDNNRILKTWDFRKKDDNPYRSSSHGTSVLSNIGGMVRGLKLGLATEAEFLLARTEVVMSERIREQEYWLAAAEWADKHGADIINSSLGYTQRNYFKHQLDGKTTIITRAANMAASKGMLVVNSAGNEGADNWHMIGAPADADSVLAIGGVKPEFGWHSDFSSFGPTADKRMKPNVSAFGTAAVAGAGGLRTATGTSFSSPLVAGFAACIMQAKPELTNMELFYQIEQSATLYPYFDYAHGFGVPQAGHVLNKKLVPDTTLDVLVGKFAVEVQIRPEFLDSASVVEDPDSLWMLPDPTSWNCMYYHVQEPNGVLAKYYVVEAGADPVTFRKLNYPLGTVLRAHYRGFTVEYVFE